MTDAVTIVLLLVGFVLLLAPLRGRRE